MIIFEVPIFFALARTSSQSSCYPISARKDDFTALVKEPAQNAAGVETTYAMLVKIL
jgi:hypothetical protein